jgi:hypothetical protein
VHYNLDVPVFVRGNEIMLSSPFDKITDQWFNRCAVKAQNVSEEVSVIFETLKQQYTIAERKVGEFKETKKSDFASSLKHCEVIYRMIASLNDDQLKRDVIELDQSFNAKKVVAHYYIGRIFDALVRDHIEYLGKTDESSRSTTTYDQFRFEIDAKFAYTGIDYRRLQSERVFKDWKNRKYIGFDGKKTVSFKADIADIVLTTDFVKSNAMYPSFFLDLFRLYDDRSKADHADRDAMVDPMAIQKLEKVLKVLFQLI